MNQLNPNLDSDSDSDSSQQATHQYTLGFDDGKIHKLEEAERCSISRIGGRPALLPLENVLIPENDLECLVCQKPIPMLIQVYCPSEQNPYNDRILYLFGCTDQKCQNQGSSRCVRGFKSWKFNEEYHRQSSAQQIGSSHPQSALQKQFELGDNPFKLNTHNLVNQPFDNPFSVANPFHDPTPDPGILKDSFSNLTLNPLEPTPTKSSAQEHNARLMSSLPVLCTPPHYLATDYELKPKLSSFRTFKDFIDEDQASPPPPSTSRNAPQNVHQALPNKKKSSARSNPPASMSPASGQETYEVQAIKGIDPAFLDFQDRINWDNQSTQIVRYNPKGRALPVHSSKPTPSIGLLRCGHRSRFELQFMPAGLCLFSAPIDWTTVWINDCFQDCCTPHPSSLGSPSEGWTEIQCFVQSVVD